MSQKHQFPLSWTHSLNKDLNVDELKQDEENERSHDILFALNENNKVLLCGREGSIEKQCSKCENYSSCFDQHCVFDNQKYYVDYIVTKEKIGFDVLVMIDDVFWHAFMRSQNLLSNPKNEFDAIVLEIHKRDSFFNAHCLKNKIPLVRFSSKDISLFLMNRSEHIVPYFISGHKKKMKKFFDHIGTSIDLFTKTIFGDEKESTK